MNKNGKCSDFRINRARSDPNIHQSAPMAPMHPMYMLPQNHPIHQMQVGFRFFFSFILLGLRSSQLLQPGPSGMHPGAMQMPPCSMPPGSVPSQMGHQMQSPMQSPVQHMMPGAFPSVSPLSVIFVQIQQR